MDSFKTNEEIAKNLYWGHFGYVHTHFNALIVASANRWYREHPILLEYTIPADPAPKKFYAFVPGCGESQTSMPWTEN